MNYLRAALHGSALPVRLLRFATSLFASLALSATIARAADSGSGSIAGSITSASTHNALQGATVAIPALNRTEFADSAGSFLLQNLPPGPVELVISYAG